MPNHPAHALLILALAAAGCSSFGGVTPMPFDPDAPPPIPPTINASHLHFTRSSVQVGDLAPDFALERVDGSGDLRLSSLRGAPTVVVFGSFT